MKGRIALLVSSTAILAAFALTFLPAARAATSVIQAHGACASVQSTSSLRQASAGDLGIPAATDGAAAASPDAPTLDNSETPGRRAYDQTRDASVLAPDSWAVMVYKSRHQLIVYYKGRLFKIYHAVFGRSPEPGTKLWAGDRRTPEGLYVIVKKYPSRRWKRFLRLNYPNRVDRYRYQEMREEGVVPAADGRPAAEGDAIGIHGTDRPIFNRSNIDWTTGCISLDNDAILELDRLLPVGTIVVIKP